MGDSPERPVQNDTPPEVPPTQPPVDMAVPQPTEQAGDKPKPENPVSEVTKVGKNGEPNTSTVIDIPPAPFPGQGLPGGRDSSGRPVDGATAPRHDGAGALPRGVYSENSALDAVQQARLEGKPVVSLTADRNSLDASTLATMDALKNDVNFVVIDPAKAGSMMRNGMPTNQFWATANAAGAGGDVNNIRPNRVGVYNAQNFNDRNPQHGMDATATAEYNQSFNMANFLRDNHVVSPERLAGLTSAGAAAAASDAPPPAALPADASGNPAAGATDGAPPPPGGDAAISTATRQAESGRITAIANEVRAAKGGLNYNENNVPQALNRAANFDQPVVSYVRPDAAADQGVENAMNFMGRMGMITPVAIDADHASEMKRSGVESRHFYAMDSLTNGGQGQSIGVFNANEVSANAAQDTRTQAVATAAANSPDQVIAALKAGGVNFQNAETEATVRAMLSGSPPANDTPGAAARSADGALPVPEVPQNPGQQTAGGDATNLPKPEPTTPANPEAAATKPAEKPSAEGSTTPPADTPAVKKEDKPQPDASATAEVRNGEAAAAHAASAGGNATDASGATTADTTEGDSSDTSGWTVGNTSAEATKKAAKTAPEGATITNAAESAPEGDGATANPTQTTVDNLTPQLTEVDETSHVAPTSDATPATQGAPATGAAPATETATPQATKPDATSTSTARMNRFRALTDGFIAGDGNLGASPFGPMEHVAAQIETARGGGDVTSIDTLRASTTDVPFGHSTPEVKTAADIAERIELAKKLDLPLVAYRSTKICEGNTCSEVNPTPDAVKSMEGRAVVMRMPTHGLQGDAATAYPELNNLFPADQVDTHNEHLNSEMFKVDKETGKLTRVEDTSAGLPEKPIETNGAHTVPEKPTETPEQTAAREAGKIAAEKAAAEAVAAAAEKVRQETVARQKEAMRQNADLFGDAPNAIAQARALDGIVVLQVRKPGCPPCNSMASSTYGTTGSGDRGSFDEVRGHMFGVEANRWNDNWWSGMPRGMVDAAESVSRYPHTFFFDPKDMSKPIGGFSGFADRATFKSELAAAERQVYGKSTLEGEPTSTTGGSHTSGDGMNRRTIKPGDSNYKLPPDGVLNVTDASSVVNSKHNVIAVAVPQEMLDSPTAKAAAHLSQMLKASESDVAVMVVNQTHALARAQAGMAPHESDATRKLAGGSFYGNNVEAPKAPHAGVFTPSDLRSDVKTFRSKPSAAFTADGFMGMVAQSGVKLTAQQESELRAYWNH